MRNNAIRLPVILFIFISFLCSCKEEKNNFLIHGKIQHGKNEIYAIYLNSGENFPIDTISVSANGKFELTGKTDSLTVVILAENRNNWIPVFVNSGYYVSVNGNYPCLSLADVKGGKCNEELNVFKAQIRQELQDKCEIEQAIQEVFYEENSGKEMVFTEQMFPKLKNLDHSIKLQAERFIKDNPGQMGSALILLDYFCRDNKCDKLQLFLPLLEKPVKDYYITDFLRKMVHKMEQVEVGNKAPDFVLWDTLKQEVSLSDFSGQYVLLHFWASDDPYSRLQNKYPLSDIYQSYLDKKQEKLSIVGVSLDGDEASWKQAILHDNIQWMNISDLKSFNSDMALNYGVFGGNKNFLINPKGIIVAQDIRPEEVQAFIQ